MSDFEQSSLATQELQSNIAQMAANLGEQAIGLFTNENPHLQGLHLDILNMSSMGFSSQVIAEKTGLAAESLGSFRRRIKESLGAKNMADAVRVAYFRGILSQHEEQHELSQPLTKREKRALNLFAHGLESPEIAAQYSRHPNTIDRWFKDIKNKLGTRDRIHSVRIALELGLIKPDFEKEKKLRQVGALSAKAALVMIVTLPEQYRLVALQSAEASTHKRKESPKRLARVLKDSIGKEFTYVEAARLIFPPSNVSERDLANRTRQLISPTRQILEAEGYELIKKQRAKTNNDKKRAKAPNVLVCLPKPGQSAEELTGESLVLIAEQAANKVRSQGPDLTNYDRWENSFTPLVIEVVKRLTSEIPALRPDQEPPKKSLDDIDSLTFLLDRGVINSKQFFEQQPLEIYGLTMALLYKYHKTKPALVASHTEARAQEIIKTTVNSRIQYLRSCYKPNSFFKAPNPN